MENNFKFTLLQNGHDFLVESVSNIRESENNKSKYKYAILHLVQSLELVIKEVLKIENELLILEDHHNINNKTIGLSKAVEILRTHPSVSASIRETITDKEKVKINKAIQLRNEITHNKFNKREEYFLAKYFEVLSIVIHINKTALKYDIEYILNSENLSFLRSKEEYLNNQKEKAISIINKEDIPESEVIKCAVCDNKTFVKLDVYKCYLCYYKANTENCDKCGSVEFIRNLRGLENHFDYDISYDASNTFGYDESEKLCMGCYELAVEEIEYQKATEDAGFDPKLHSVQN